MIAIDLFSGAGGMSLGAILAGIRVKLAIEINLEAAKTYQRNHKDTTVYNGDIIGFEPKLKKDKSTPLIIFGGPPCKGFSTSNQRTRSKNNPTNWLYLEFIRIVKLLKPEWIVFENVTGITETESGIFLHEVINNFKKLGYTISYHKLNSLYFGVPQRRSRIFVIGSLDGILIDQIQPKDAKFITVREAFHDLPQLENGASIDILKYRCKAKYEYSKKMRGNLNSCSNHLVTKSSKLILERYSHVPPGGNWENIPSDLMQNYKNRKMCHTGIYHRLDPNQPAKVIGNFRKNMLIHPFQNRGLSVREAARLQSFPDWYHFDGSIGFQQEQVGNAVPPLLAKAVFESITMKGF